MNFFTGFINLLTVNFLQVIWIISWITVCMHSVVYVYGFSAKSRFVCSGFWDFIYIHSVTIIRRPLLNCLSGGVINKVASSHY